MSTDATTHREIVLQTGGDYLVPAAGLEQILATYQLKKQFIEQVLKDGVDFGVTPGTGEKPSLKKAGAEKMATFFGLVPVFEDVATVEDWAGAEHAGEPFFYYRQKCKLYRGERLVGSADGSCNSWEKKYRYRWVSEFDIPAGVDKTTLRAQGGKQTEFAFAIERAETGGQYGKPAAYWQRWRDAIAGGTARATKRKSKNGRELDAFEMDSTLYAVKNLDAAEQTNTILKMAQKRALVAAVLITTNASDYFTQDLDDMGDFVDGKIVDAASKTTAADAPSGQPAEAPAAGDQVAQPALEAAAAEQPEQLSDNPDPVPAAMRDAYSALCQRAEKVNVAYSLPDFDKITKADLAAEHNGLLKRVRAAEADRRQAKA